MHDLCHTHEWVMSHIWRSHDARMYESCHTCEWVTWHVWMRHVTHMKESCHTCEWAISHVLMKSHIYNRKWSSDVMMTDFKGIFWISRVTHCNTLQHTATHCSTLQHTAAHCNTLQHTATHMNESCHTSKCVISHVWMSHFTRMNARVKSHIWTSHVTRMGWLRLVGCLKIQVSLQNTGLFCRALLQKRPIFLSILLIVATPYE